MMPRNKNLILACLLTLSQATALAQDVELYSSDGTLSVHGELVDFVNQTYTIGTSIGNLSFDANTMLCKGDTCPDINPPLSASGTPLSVSSTAAADFSIVGLGTQASKMMRELLPAYARSRDAQINRNADGAYVLSNAANEQFASVLLSDTSSSSSLPALLKQQATIALTTQSLLLEQASDLNSGQQSDQTLNIDHVIGLNALTIVTAQDNPVDAISTSDVAKVFMGEITNWSELNGPDAPITLYGPQLNSELARMFETRLIGADNDPNTQLSEDILEVEDVAEQVASEPNGIGFTYFSNSHTAKTLDIQGDCGLAMPANSFTIKAEEYPLTQRFYAHHSAQTNIEQVSSLLSFTQSDAGQEIISRHGLVDQRDASDSIRNQGVRFVNAIASSATDAESELLRELVTQIIGSTRLSTTFRFDTGSDQMDQRAQTDIMRLADKLKSPASQNSVVHILGFTDSIGDFELNQQVSLRRANQIRDALITIDPSLIQRVSIQPAGFGEIAPIACNENAQGRSINRRVEVWINKGETTPIQ